jgi:integrase
MVKPRSTIRHVKFVHNKRTGKTYAYFNTGRKKPDGKPIYFTLPDPDSVEFWASLASCKAGRNRKAAEVYTVAKLCDDYERSEEFNKNRSAGTRKTYGAYIPVVVDLLGKADVNAVTRAHIQLILDGEEWGAGKRNLFVAVIGALYKWARARGKTEAHPTRGIEKAEMGEHLAWPDEMLATALAAPNDRVRLAVALLYYTGQRIGDVCAMRWGNVKDGAISFTQQKTRKSMGVPFFSDLKAELDSYGKRGLTLLTNRIGGPMRPDNLRDEIKAFCKANGHPELVPHGLRKNAVIHMLTVGCTVAQTAAITGQTYQLVEYYAKRIDQRRMAGEAMAKMEHHSNVQKLENAGRKPADSRG